MTVADARDWLARNEKHPAPLGVGPVRQWRWQLPASEATDGMSDLPPEVFGRLNGPSKTAPWLFYGREAALTAAAVALHYAVAAGWTPRPLLSRTDRGST